MAWARFSAPLSRPSSPAEKSDDDVIEDGRSSTEAEAVVLALSVASEDAASAIIPLGVSPEVVFSGQASGGRLRRSSTTRRTKAA